MLKIENERPENIKFFASRLEANYDQEMSVEINIPKGMYHNTLSDAPTEHIEYEGMLQFLANGWLDASFLHWCQM